ncbi:hypothetical protein ACM614_04690, partial [Streptomyces sp. 12297]
MRFRLPAWTATLTWKSACFIVVMCCTLAAVLGGLVHVEVTRQTVHTAREKALAKLTDTARAYEAGDPLPHGSGIDPAGLPHALRELAAVSLASAFSRAVWTVCRVTSTCTSPPSTAASVQHITTMKQADFQVRVAVQAGSRNLIAGPRR